MYCKVCVLSVTHTTAVRLTQLAVTNSSGFHVPLLFHRCPYDDTDAATHQQTQQNDEGEVESFPVSSRGEPYAEPSQAFAQHLSSISPRLSRVERAAHLFALQERNEKAHRLKGQFKRSVGRANATTTLRRPSAGAARTGPRTLTVGPEPRPSSTAPSPSRGSVATSRRHPDRSVPTTCLAVSSRVTEVARPAREPLFTYRVHP